MNRRTGISLAWLGVIIGWVGYFFAPTYGLLLLALVIDLALAVWGCYIWAKAKGQSGVLALWGLLAPIGFLGVALVKNKSASPPAA